MKTNYRSIVLRNLFEEYCEKKGFSPEDGRSVVNYRKKYSGYSKSEKCLNCYKCSNLIFYDYDDVTFEKVLQCNFSKEMFGSLYCRDNVKEMVCNKFNLKLEDDTYKPTAI
jgi:hypothetical protein